MRLPNDARLGIVLAVAVALAVATTTLSVHIAPSVWVLVAAAVVASVALAVPQERAAAMGVALVTGLAAAHVLLRPGLPQVHDDLHVWGFWAYARAAQAGHWMPMWIPDLGAGMPLLQFYGPVSFLSVLPGVLAHAAPVALWKEAMVQSDVLAVVAVLLGARLLGAGWRGASVAAVAMAFSPWRLTVVNFRGAVGECTALAFAPIVAAAVLSLAKRPSRGAAWAFGAGLALLVPTHLITLFCLGIALVPAIVVQELAGTEAPVMKRFAGLAVPGAIAIGLVAVWLVPCIVEGKDTSLSMQTETHRYFIYDEHGVGARDLLVRREWDTLRSSLKASDRAAGAEGQQMPFYIGLVLFGAALTSPWWSRSRATWAPAAGALAGLVFSSAPAAIAMTHLPMIHKIQFPWRFLTAGTILACYAVGLGVSALVETKPRWTRALPVLLLPALLVFDGAPYTGAAGWIPPYHGITHWVRDPKSNGTEPFDTVMRPVPQDWSGASGLMRVGDLTLPPDDTTTPVALFWVSYPEWMTPPLYRACLAADSANDWAALGVSRFFFPNHDHAAVLEPAPYAAFEREGREIDAGAFTREPGHIALHLSAPSGGSSIVIREQMFPGWEARVDGKLVPIATTQVGYMRLALTEGAHEVVLDYTRHTPARRTGLVMSVMTIFVALAIRKRS
ncbi:MAG TPA: hypothetical protein VFV19_06325 [Candidatus Polarisedimenticolaceae bacterium]|nr:hypothetical protein [Candidatus Polarisedimenticolaceae bacterium]